MMTQPEKIDHILAKSAEYFGRTRAELFAQSRRQTKCSNERRLLIPMLFEKTSLKQKEIGILLGYNNIQTVQFHYRAIKDELADGAYGFEKTKTVYKELSEYIGL